MRECHPRNSVSLIAAIGATLFAVAFTAQRASATENLTVCVGDFALCAASTCTPDGKKIAVNGTSMFFEEAQCTCPIFDGPNIADVNGGNMKGSCAPPSANGVWSTYFPQGRIPQAINDWRRQGDKAAAPGFICPATEMNNFLFTNCFSFACTRAGRINGVPVATCYCPIQEFDGGPVTPGTPFFTQAGQCNESICSQYPVGGVFAFDDLTPGQCLELPGERDDD
jgi:hypothetical protein